MAGRPAGGRGGVGGSPPPAPNKGCRDTDPRRRSPLLRIRNPQHRARTRGSAFTMRTLVPHPRSTTWDGGFTIRGSHFEDFFPEPEFRNAIFVSWFRYVSEGHVSGLGPRKRSSKCDPRIVNPPLRSADRGCGIMAGGKDLRIVISVL